MSFSVMLEQLTAGMGKSMGIFFLTLLFSLLLGLFVTLGHMSKNKILSGIFSESLTANSVSYYRLTSMYLSNSI